MNLNQQFHMLGKRQLAIEDGLQLLRHTKIELLQARSSATTWGQVAVVANAVLIPLNCILNAFELGAATTVYQKVVQLAYEHVAASGTRSEGAVTEALALLKKSLVAALAQKGSVQYIPGVNILAGLAQDSWALWQSASDLSANSKESAQLFMKLERTIDEAMRQLQQLGVQRAQVLDKMVTLQRTA
ncbi:MAG: hypothetical protein QM777_21835 [Pseudorhodoferax sp.]